MTKNLRIVFMGTPGFAVEGLSRLHASEHEVVTVVTAPDRPAGRGRKMRASEVKDFAIDHGLPILQPEKLRDPEFISELKNLNADLFVVVAFRMLPEMVWSIPSKGTINLHASLLPQYRGAAPINWAIINGETKTGATTFFINAEIDKGKIIDKVEVDISPDDDAGDLHDRLMHFGSELLVSTVDHIADGTAKAIEQDADGSELKKAPKLNPENRKIDWSRSAEDIHNLIRGLSPYPSAYSTLQIGEEEPMMCKIFSCRNSQNEGILAPGHVRTDNRNYLHVGTGTSDIEIVHIQIPGKRKMGIKDLLNGFNIEQEAFFT